MFIKLTGLSDTMYLVNADRVQIMWCHEGKTIISFAGDETFTVLETPEEIQQMIAELYA